MPSSLPPRGRDRARVALAVWCALTCACSASHPPRSESPEPSEPSEPSNGTPPTRSAWWASAWPEADALFHSDPRWVGGDDAHSVDLGGGRVLWLFGDTLIDPTARGTREGARFVSNSLALQRGANPAEATASFHWGAALDAPAAFFPDAEGPPKVRYWPGNGWREGATLVVFLMQVHAVEGGLGFEVRAWEAAVIENPDERPDAWRWHLAPRPSVRGQLIVGTGGILRDGEHVLAYAAEEPGPRHRIYAARWRAVDFARGDLRALEWWCGPSAAWVLDSLPECAPAPVFEHGQTEFTVHNIPRLGGPGGTWLEAQTIGFGPASIALRRAARPTGPWTEPEVVYTPPEATRPRIMIYAGKAHPHLRGADLVLTYATNSFEFADLWREPSLYYPRFVRIAVGRQPDRDPTTDH